MYKDGDCKTTASFAFCIYLLFLACWRTSCNPSVSAGEKIPDSLNDVFNHKHGPLLNKVHYVTKYKDFSVRLLKIIILMFGKTFFFLSLSLPTLYISTETLMQQT